MDGRERVGEQVQGWAPGRVNLIGEHTDHTDGLALPMAIEQGIDVTAIAGGTRIVLDSATELGGPLDVAADGSELPAEGWGRYVAAVAAELAALGRPPVGLSGTVTSTLQAGIGLSSSAALEVAVAVTLLRAAAAEGWVPDVDARVLALACRRAEHRAVGVPSGVLDQAASLLGRTGSAVLLDCQGLRWSSVRLPPGTVVVVVDSGVRRQLETSGYAARTRELGAALGVLQGRRPADVDPSELPDLLAGLDAVPARRLRHVVTENDRVRRTVEAFAADDRDAVGALFAASHESLRTDFEVTVPQTDALVGMLQAEGAIGARMTGGGFGGAVIGLVAADGAEDLAMAVADRYAASFPELTPVTLVSGPAQGAAALAEDVVAVAADASATDPCRPLRDRAPRC